MCQRCQCPERTSFWDAPPGKAARGGGRRAAAGRERGQGCGSGAYRGGRARAGPGPPSPCGMPVHPAVFLCCFGAKAGGYVDMPATGAGPDPACRFVGVPWAWLICVPAGNGWLRRRGGLSVDESPRNGVFAIHSKTFVPTLVTVEFPPAHQPVPCQKPRAAAGMRCADREGAGVALRPLVVARPACFAEKTPPKVCRLPAAAPAGRGRMPQRLPRASQCRASKPEPPWGCGMRTVSAGIALRPLVNTLPPTTAGMLFCTSTPSHRGAPPARPSAVTVIAAPIRGAVRPRV